MIRHVKKLVFGKPEHNIPVSQSPVAKQWQNLESVWENDQHNDSGLERLLRLFMLAIQFLFPGIYIRQTVFRRGQTVKNILIEIYVLFKLFLPLSILYFDQSHNHWFLGVSGYLLLETLTYVSSLVLVSDIHQEVKSVNRSLLLLLINYLEITLNFAMIYHGFNLLTPNAQSVIDHIYFSFITSASVGYGDIHPDTQMGKVLVCFQTFTLLVFVVLFINHFGSKRHHR